MQFYSYLWLRDDTTPYYAGKGSGDRAFLTKTHKVKPPVDKSLILVFSHATEEEAFESEKNFIKWFGRKDLGTGCLRNFTDGGEGRAGYKIPAESRLRMGASQKGNQNSVAYKRSAAGRQETSRLMTGSKRTLASRAKISAAVKAAWGRKKNAA
jgi:hypothetical protein